MGESGNRTTASRFAQLANLAGVGGVLAIVMGMVAAAVAYEGTVGQPYRIANRLNGWFRWIVGPVGLLTGVFGTLVGLCPMNNLGAHMFVANGFFYPGLATMLLFSGYVLASRHREFPRWIAVPGLLAAGALFAFLFLGGLVENLVNTTGSPPGFGINRPDVWVSALFEWVAIGAILAWVAVVALIVAVRDHGHGDDAGPGIDSCCRWCGPVPEPPISGKAIQRGG